jgi:hypothetical protein
MRDSGAATPMDAVACQCNKAADGGHDGDMAAVYPEFGP